MLTMCAIEPALAEPTDIAETASAAKPNSSLAVRKRAVSLMNSGKFAAAFDMLKAAQKDFPDDQDVRFLIGQCALEIKQPEVAISQFEAMLASNPDLPRVRLELARAYTASRDFDRAREQFGLVMASNPPPAVGDNVRKFLDMIEAQRSWHARASLAFVSDSNVNTGPGSNSVLGGGLTGTGVTGRSDNAWNLIGSLNHVHVFDPHFAWQSDVSVNVLDYSEENASDLAMLSLSSGPTWSLDKYTVSAPLVYDHIDVGHNPYNWSIGLAPQLQYALNADTQFNGGFTMAWRKHDPVAAQPRNGQVYGVTAGARIRLGDKGYLQPGVRLGREQTEQDYFDNHSWGMNLGYILPLPMEMTLFAQPSVTRASYGAADPFLAGTCNGCDNVRRDWLYQFTVNLSKAYGKTGLSTALGYTYTRNDSNVGLYDYDRHMVTAMLTWIY
jgi:tetratricopeptide (TPR) repeat protein